MSLEETAEMFETGSMAQNLRNNIKDNTCYEPSSVVDMLKIYRLI
jgi:hypothetical protein